MISIMGNSTIGNSPYQWGISVVGFLCIALGFRGITTTYYAQPRLGRNSNTLIARITA